MSRGPVVLSELARRLGMSGRTLQRRLVEEGTTYRAVIDEVRRGWAEQLLGEARASSGEVAALLGFADVPAFHRAFVRWTGMTPASFRRRRCSLPCP
jgi:AraC-like DNA-binding protein